MAEHYFSDDSFEHKNYTDSPLPSGEYENGFFSNCRFAESDLSKRVFIDCEFSNCDLSTASLDQTAFRNVQFMDCKLSGLHFDHAADFLFEVSFKRCRLDLSSFSTIHTFYLAILSISESWRAGDLSLFG